jgi:hypothetical protein
MHPRRSISRQSKKFSGTQRNKKVLTSVLVVICIVTVIFSLSKLSSLSVWTIQNIQIFGADPDITKTVQDAAWAPFTGDALHLFSRANSFLYPRAALIRAVKSSSPRIDTVDVRRDGLRGLIVSVSQKVPAALVCSNLPNFSGDKLIFDEDDSCYFSDATGYIFAKAPTFSGHIYHRYYVPSLDDAATTSDAIIGSFATTTEKFHALEDAYASMRQAGIGTEAVLLKDNGEYEFYADQLIRQPTRAVQAEASTTDSVTSIIVIYMNDSRALTDELLNVISFWNHEVGSARATSSVPAFEYIDVRYGSNVFYRVAK